MTTIVTDGKILIADSRTTRASSEGITPGSTWTDNSLKIHVFPKNTKLTIKHKDEELVPLAVGFSGRSTMRPKIFSMFSKMREGDPVKTLAMCTGFAPCGPFTLVFLCKDNIVFTFDAHYNEHGFTISKQCVKLKDGELRGSGTGYRAASAFSLLAPGLKTQDYTTAAAFADKSSNNCFIVFDSADHLLKPLVIAQSEAELIVRRVGRQMGKNKTLPVKDHRLPVDPESFR